MPLPLFVALALAAPVAPAPRARPAAPQAITIVMTDQGFAPRRFVLRRGAPYVLRVVNRSGKGHNLTQKAFFEMARVAPGDRGQVRDGQIVLPAGARATIRLEAPTTRPGGTYQFHSTVLADADDDYTGVFTMR